MITLSPYVSTDIWTMTILNKSGEYLHKLLGILHRRFVTSPVLINLLNHLFI